MDKFDQFKQLHERPEPLVIANAWNVKSAQLIEQAGFAAIATSSGAIAESLGYKDGEQIPLAEMLYIVKRIKASTTLPLSVDMERGYSDNIGQLTGNVQQLLNIGVSGINIEDSQGEDIYLKKLYAIKNHLERTNQKLFINARTDGFLQKIPQPLETTLRRAAKYQDAGANGLFVTGLADIETVEKITSSIGLPLNVVCLPGNPEFSSTDKLQQAGVSRISMAVFLYKSTYNSLERVLSDIKEQSAFHFLR
jgi:2-methylisocitrate lyase-like PEP mutase family enzyme